MSKPIWNADVKSVDAIVSMAKTQGTAEGKGSQALPNIALAFAAAAAAGNVADIKADATKIYVAYGNARNKSGAGKPINVNENKIATPLSKLGAFAKLAMDKTVLPGTNRSVSEAFFEAFAYDFDLLRGSHYENLYKLVANQLSILTGDKDTAPEARVMSKVEAEHLLAIKVPVGQIEADSLKAILDGIEDHINGKKAKKSGLVSPTKPGFGDPTGDLKSMAAKLRGLLKAAEQRADKAWNKVSKNADAFADDEADETSENNSEARSFMGAQ